MVSAQPGASYEATFAAGETGLTGTLMLGLLDNVGGTVDELSNDGIVELESSGVYAATRTAPETAGQFTLLWSLDGTTDPDQVFVDDLVVPFTLYPAGPTGPTYATVAELQRLIPLRNPTAEQNAACERILIASTGEIDAETGAGTATPLAGWELSLAAEVCLERALEHWQQSQVPFGAIGLGDAVPIMPVRDTWDRHAHKLAPLKRGWGLS